MIAEVIVGAITAVTLGCLWLSGKVLDKAYEEQPGDLYDFVDIWMYCPLCSRGYVNNEGKSTAKFGESTHKRGYFHVKCTICGGEFDMKVSKEPPQEDD